jgi:hypothetical protein
VVYQRAMLTRRLNFRWRGAAVCLLTTLGIVTFVGFTLIHWTERQILTTDNWVKIIGPLPKNDVVATALSNYSVSTLFSGVNVEQKISNVLPPRAAFLAPTLATQLKTSLTKGTKNIVESDQFSSLWITANRDAHARLMANARQTSTSPVHSRTTNIKLNLSSLSTRIRSLLGVQSGSLLNSSSTNKTASSGISLKVKIKTGLATFGRYVRTVDFLDGTLGFFALACLVGGILLTYFRRRLIIIIGSSILVVGLLQLIAVKAVRPTVLNQIQNVAYRPAVGVVYNDLVASFHKTAVFCVVIGGLITLLAFLFKPNLLSQNKVIGKRLKILRRSKVYKELQNARLQVKNYRWQIMGIVTLITLILLAFVFNLDGQSLVRSLLILILLIECINLVAARPRRMPMKQATVK